MPYRSRGVHTTSFMIICLRVAQFHDKLFEKQGLFQILNDGYIFSVHHFALSLYLRRDIQGKCEIIKLQIQLRSALNYPVSVNIQLSKIITLSQRSVLVSNFPGRWPWTQTGKYSCQIASQMPNCFSVKFKYLSNNSQQLFNYKLSMKLIILPIIYRRVISICLYLKTCLLVSVLEHKQLRNRLRHDHFILRYSVWCESSDFVRTEL